MSFDRKIRVARAVIDHDGRWLMQRRHMTKHLGGFWQFPGGRIDESESDQQALRRHVHTSLWLPIVVGGLLEVSFDHNSPPLATLFYQAKILDGWRNPPSPLDGELFSWFTLVEIKTLLCIPSSDEVIRVLDARTG